MLTRLIQRRKLRIEELTAFKRMLEDELRNTDRELGLLEEFDHGAALIEVASLEWEKQSHVPIACRDAGVTTLGQIASMGRHAFELLPYIGRKSVEEVDEKLRFFGLRWKNTRSW